MMGRCGGAFSRLWRFSSSPILVLLLMRVSNQNRELARFFLLQDDNSVGLSTPSGTPATKPFDFQFYLLDLPELTTWLIGNHTAEAERFYSDCLNEERAEIWFHRALLLHPSRTFDAATARAVIIPGYFHLNHHLLQKQMAGVLTVDDWLPLVEARLVSHLTHVLACPSWNPQRANQIGLPKLVRLLQESASDFASFGFERNQYWQKMETSRVIVIPYVVQLDRWPTLPTKRSANIFYAGDSRPHAVAWAGCNRTALLGPLQNQTNLDVRLIHDSEDRLTLSDYHRRVSLAEKCLILCGDTPSSRSLASAVVHGCVPVIIGSRLRGYCEPPCHAGWGWSIANQSHLPYDNGYIDWSVVPEIPEAEFLRDPLGSLQNLHVDPSVQSLLQNQRAFVYGVGSPVHSNEFGSVASYALHSLQLYLLG